MTSFRQIEANRRNAVRSTGPNTEEGKRRSRRNAIRHRLCAETVIENIEDYTAFEAAVIVDYDAQTAVERELVLRLASLLWRLRRSTAIETDLLRIQAKILRDHRDQRQQAVRFRVLEAAMLPEGRNESMDDWNDGNLRHANQHRADCSHSSRRSQDMVPVVTQDMAWRDLAHCFQRLTNLDNAGFERLGRYETMLWRQMVQILFVLQSVRRR
jgi:hypothetical protein